MTGSQQPSPWWAEASRWEAPRIAHCGRPTAGPSGGPLQAHWEARCGPLASRYARYNCVLTRVLMRMLYFAEPQVQEKLVLFFPILR